MDGLVIDLRDNGGGALTEANQLVGLFVESGPTVQVRGPDGSVQVFEDQENGVVWDGPIIVLVNNLSASASEIFAGAMQDYDRALIMGSQTFGKGHCPGGSTAEPRPSQDHPVQVLPHIRSEHPEPGRGTRP